MIQKTKFPVLTFMSLVGISQKIATLSIESLHASILKNITRSVWVTNDEKNFDSLILNIKNEKCQNSFHQVFLHYYKVLFAYFKKNGHETQKCSELTQEALLIVWKKASHFDPNKGNSHTWIFTIARNLRFDALRLQTKNSLALSSEDIFSIESSTTDIDNSFSNEIHHNIELLPNAQQEVIHALYFEGYTQSEYSKKTKIPIGTVKSRVRLALESIKKGLKK